MTANKRSAPLRPCALLVDDERSVRELVGKALRAEGYDILLCANRQELDRHLGGRHIDIFVVDVMLPDGNGMQIARELRQSTDAGIILLTGRHEEMDQVLGLELGADDYVTKPFRVRELRARVNAVYRRVAGRNRPEGRQISRRADDVLSLKGLAISPSARTVRRDTGESIELTTTEFDILLVLASNRNRVLSRDQIMDAVRGPNWTVYDRAVDGLVSRLRGKLGPGEDGRERIKTVRGVGYVLSD